MKSFTLLMLFSLMPVSALALLGTPMWMQSYCMITFGVGLFGVITLPLLPR